MTKSPTPPPSHSDALRFSKQEQLDKKGAPLDAALPFSKQQQIGQRPGATRPAPPAVTRERPRLPDADLPFSKTKQIGKERGKSRPGRAVKTRRS